MLYSYIVMLGYIFMLGYMLMLLLSFNVYVI
jgi:hypothetical protein